LSQSQTQGKERGRRMEGRFEDDFNFVAGTVVE
jgi:hypothetical protein